VEICRLDADVIVLPEAHHGTVADGVDERLQQYGYHWHDVMYSDIAHDTTGDDRSEPVYLRVLSRLPIEEVREVRFGDIRSLLRIVVVDPETQRRIRLFAIHLDDRAEVLRMIQVKAIVHHLAGERLPTVLLGDFNAVWDGPMARVMRSRLVRWLASHMPGVWLRSVATRFTDMASGTTLDILAEEAGVRDADVNRQPTATPKLYGVEWLPSIRIAQLDHILLSSDLAATHVEVAGDGGADHRAISAMVHIKT
jgi:endonuclease/exonuclease/phosphatase family metal-dependent hydrolase